MMVYGILLASPTLRKRFQEYVAPGEESDAWMLAQWFCADTASVHKILSTMTLNHFPVTSLAPDAAIMRYFVREELTRRLGQASFLSRHLISSHAEDAAENRRLVEELAQLIGQLEG